MPDCYCPGMPVNRRTTDQLTALGAVYFVYCVVSHNRGIPSPCVFRALTRHKCPLCGLSTAIGQALRGDLRGAHATHPLALPAIVAVAMSGWSRWRR